MEEQEQTGRFSDLTAAASRTGVEDNDWPILAKSQQHDDGDDNQKELLPYSVFDCLNNDIIILDVDHTHLPLQD